MSLSTLLEAAKYLDYLDSNNRQAPNNPRLVTLVATEQQQQRTFACNRANQEDHTFNLTADSLSSDVSLSSSPSSYPPPIYMARVQPMILSSSSPPGHSILTFQPATGSSPTSSSSSYSRHRELHKTLEKNRRAHLRHCFELLKAELPASECVDKKTSHINIIKSAIRYILALRQQEREIDNEIQRLTKLKNDLTKGLSSLQLNQLQQQTPQHQEPPSQIDKLQQDDQKSKGHAKLQNQLEQEQLPAAEQQLSFLLSQSKID